VAEAEDHCVSVEMPLPVMSKTTVYGCELRLLYDFARIETNEFRLGKLLNRVKWTRPPDDHCFFLWRQVGIGATNKSLERPRRHITSIPAWAIDEPEFCPCSPHSLYRNGGFHGCVAKSRFYGTQEAQQKRGVSPVCDFCRHNDTRDPHAFSEMNRLVSAFVEEHKLQKFAME